ncbi:SH3 domain and tetratricopeptide repeat-containing protein 1 [Neosynchiropus ocellatus]
MTERNCRHSRMVRSFSRDSASLKRTLSTCEESIPSALPLLLDMVSGPDRLPAGDEMQEMLRGKLRALEADSTEVDALFMEMSAHLVSVDSEDKVIFVTFKAFEEMCKFSAYYTHRFLGHCLESLLFDQKVWLIATEKDISIEVSFDESRMNLLYKSILMQEGSLFACCTSNQMFDSSTSGGDLYLEQGEIAQFEPPFLGSGWTVLCLADGARGTSPKPALEPVTPFHQLFLKSCPESILVGDGKSSSQFPLQFARGTCVAAASYDSEGPDELRVSAGDRVNIVGFLASCFDWFMGENEATGEVGLLKTDLVKCGDSVYEADDILLDGEDGMFSTLDTDEVINETIALLKNRSQNDTWKKYKLDFLTSRGSRLNISRENIQSDLKRNIATILEDSSQDSPLTSMTSQQKTQSRAESQNSPCFAVDSVEEGNGITESCIQLLSFLNGREFKPEFGALYGLSSDLIASSAFSGHSDQDELIGFLAAARETARKKRLLWSQTRLCFLLARLCAGRTKFSQARVYFEEALSLPHEGFLDFRLLASIYSNLSVIYLLQKNTERFFHVSERLAALLMAFPFCLECMEDNLALRFVLKKAILSENKSAEARGCYLLAKHHWSHSEGAQVVAFLERLLLLCAPETWSLSASHGYLALANLYRKLHLPHLSVSSAWRASLHGELTHSLSGIRLVMDAAKELHGVSEQEAPLPAHIAPFLHQSLLFTKLSEGETDPQHVLSYHLTTCLCQLLTDHGMVGNAIYYMHTLINSSPPLQQLRISLRERKNTLIWLAGLHIDNNQPEDALEILESILDVMPEHCTTQQEGLVLNMCGVAFRCMGDLRRAAESYQAAIDICQEYDDLSNWAVAQANLGMLCVRAGAKGLALRNLSESVQLFSELDDADHMENFIFVLLELGKLYVKQQRTDFGKGCYEWALLLAISANRSECQLTAARHLCRLYGFEKPDQAKCIIYSQYLVQLLHRTKDRRQEAEALETVSKLYLTLGTERAYRAALDYTKTSLGIFIDLGCKEKEAYSWLESGKIYHLLGQTELVELYVQAAQDVALTTGDTKFILKILEAAGDIFFNSDKDQDKAVTFYRDRALPIAVKSGCVHTKLRLCNKLTEALLNLNLDGEALEFAQTSLDISITLGDRLNERVAYHRLGSLYHSLKQCELAEHHYLKALTLCPSPLQFDEETLYYARVYQTLGDIIFYDLKDPFDAAGYYHLALAAAMDVGNKKSQMILCTRLATIYHNFLVDRELSLYFYQKARGFAAELNMKRINISPDQIQRTEDNS